MEKFGRTYDSIVPRDGQCTKASRIWKNITKPVADGCDCSNFVMDGPVISLRNGEIIDFWEDDSIGGVVLKYAYSRVFALAIKKEGRVVEFGSWQENEWVWQIGLRRRL